MTAIKARGETPFEEAGLGIVLRFLNSDIKQLQADEAIGQTLVPTITAMMMEGAIPVELLEKVARAGAKKESGSREPAVIDDEVFDGIVVAVLAEKVLDGLYGAVHGKTFKEYIEQSAAAFEEARERGEPPPQFRPDTIGSTISAKDPSGQESASRSSGASLPVKQLNS